MASDDPALDEDLPQSGSWSPRRKTLMTALAAVLLLAVLVLAVARIASHSSSPHAGPATVTVPPSSSSSASASASASTTSRSATATPDETRPRGLSKPPNVLPVLHQLSAADIATAHARCPRLAPTCTTTGETPSSVIGVLKSTFPNARNLVAVTDIAYSDSSGPRLVYRLLSVRTGRRTIVVEVRQSQPDDGVGSIELDDDSESVYRTQALVDGLTVELQISAPPRTYLRKASLPNLTVASGLRAVG